jgi:hypothetical protein
MMCDKDNEDARGQGMEQSFSKWCQNCVSICKKINLNIDVSYAKINSKCIVHQNNS